MWTKGFTKETDTILIRTLNPLSVLQCWALIDGETMEIVTDFIFLGSKITEDDDSNHKI